MESTPTTKGSSAATSARSPHSSDINPDYPSLDEPGRTAPTWREDPASPWLPFEQLADIVEVDAGLEVSRAQAENSKSPEKARIPWRALLTLVIVGLIAYGVSLRANHSLDENPISPAGWNDLIACSPATSFDGRRRLTLFETRAAELTEVASQEGENDRVTVGKWGYDEVTKKYAITFNDETTTYSLLARADIASCMLVRGEMDAANLSKSWFATIDEGPAFDVPEHDPY